MMVSKSSDTIWDLPLRIFHWSLATLVITNLIIGEISPADMSLHFYIGYGIIGLLVFRVIWGLIGPKNARFVNFIYGPRTTFSYLKTLPMRKPSHWVGHNPMGALSVFALLGLLGIQSLSGLFADPEDYINAGPFADQVDAATNQMASGWHETLSSLLIVLVVLHIGAILFYKFWKKDDLITPMVTGKRRP
ncbi:MAG: cytochrome b/b6 domain-containing protein [Halocynthiibacter sp.]